MVLEPAALSNRQQLIVKQIVDGATYWILYKFSKMWVFDRVVNKIRFQNRLLAYM